MHFTFSASHYIMMQMQMNLFILANSTALFQLQFHWNSFIWVSFVLFVEKINLPDLIKLKLAILILCMRRMDVLHCIYTDDLESLKTTFLGWMQFGCALFAEFVRCEWNEAIYVIVTLHFVWHFLLPLRAATFFSLVSSSISLLKNTEKYLSVQLHGIVARRWKSQIDADVGTSQAGKCDSIVSDAATATATATNVAFVHNKWQMHTKPKTLEMRTPVRALASHLDPYCATENSFDLIAAMTLQTNCIATSLTSSGSVSFTIPPLCRKHIFCLCVCVCHMQTTKPYHWFYTHYLPDALSFCLSLARALANAVAHKLQSWMLMREISCGCIYF